MAASLGAVLRHAREVRGFTASQTARGAGISQAYITKLENDEVRRPSPVVLQRLGEVLGIPYGQLMTLVGYAVPGVAPDDKLLGAVLFADLTEDERDELLEYLAWYRARKKSRRRRGGSPNAK